MNTRAAVSILVAAVLTAGAMPIVWGEWNVAQTQAMRKDAEFRALAGQLYMAARGVLVENGDPYTFQPVAKRVLPDFQRYAKRFGSTPGLGTYLTDIIPLIEEARKTPAEETITPVFSGVEMILHYLDHPNE